MLHLLAGTVSIRVFHLVGESIKNNPKINNKIIKIIIIIILQEANHAGIYIPKNHSHSSPAGAESDSNPTAAAPSQTEVTDLNCSVVEWSGQLRSVTSVWLGAAAAGLESDSAPAGEE